MVLRGMTRSHMLKASAGLLLTGLLAACGETTSKLTGPPKRTGKTVELTHWTYLPRKHTGGQAHMTTIEEQAGRLAADLNVTVKIEYAPKLSEKVVVAAAGGKPPNTAWQPYWDGARLLAGGMVVNPDEELKRERAWAPLRADIFPLMLQTVMWQGKLTCIPSDTNCRGIYYDKAVLTKAGVQPPSEHWTRDEFTEKVVKASRPPEWWGFTFSPGSLDFLIFYGAAGGDIMNSEQTKWTVDTELGRDTLQYMYDLVYKHKAVPAPPPGELMRKGEGKVAFDISGSFRLPRLRLAGVDAGSAPIPKHTRNYTIAHGSVITIFKVPDKEAQHAAALLAMWMNSPQFQVPFMVKSKNVPVSKATLNDVRYQAAIAQDPAFKTFPDQAQYMRRVPTFPSTTKSERSLSPFIKKVMNNKIGINEALSEGQRAMQAVLDNDLRTGGV